MKALIFISEGFEDPQLLVPLYWLLEEGVKVDVAAVSKGILRGTRGQEVEIRKTIEEVRPDDYTALVLPGGRAMQAMPKRVLDLVRYFIDRNKVVAAACEGLHVLIASGALRGRRVVCHKSVLITEILGAGALCDERDVVVDGKLVTCRRLGDLPAFSRAVIDLIENEKWYYTMEDVLAPCMN